MLAGEFTMAHFEFIAIFEPKGIAPDNTAYVQFDDADSRHCMIEYPTVPAVSSSAWIMRMS